MLPKLNYLFSAKVIFEYVDVALALREHGERNRNLPEKSTLREMAEESFKILNLENDLTQFEQCILYSLYVILES